MEKEITTQVQETQTVLHRINTRLNMARKILIKLNTKNIKGSKGKATNNIEENPHKVNSRSFCRNTAVQKEVIRYI